MGGTPALPADPFQLGVASGDPLPDSVVLWTRLAVDPMSPEPMPPVKVPVRWEIAADERFGKVVRSGRRTTGPELGHSVHIDARGLDAGHDYFYRFRVGDYVSATGRTRTAPGSERRLNRLTFAVTSCQSYQAGYYTAYQQMSRDDLAFVVFLGDYIYELPLGSVRQHGLPPSVTLDDFRRHYAAHHADTQLQAAHAAAPWIMTWDDHEVEDNYAGLQPGELGRARDPEGSSNFAAKRAAAYRAWWENVPVRAKPPGTDGSMRIYRSFRFGDLITMPVVDDRQYRTPLATAGRGPATPAGGYPQLPAALDPNATILGNEQERWLLRTLDRSDARWNFLAQQTQMAAVDVTPEDESNGYSADAWDGYVAARNRLLGHVEKAKVRELRDARWRHPHELGRRPARRLPEGGLPARRHRVRRTTRHLAREPRSAVRRGRAPQPTHSPVRHHEQGLPARRRHAGSTPCRLPLRQHHAAAAGRARDGHVLGRRIGQAGSTTDLSATPPGAALRAATTAHLVRRPEYRAKPHGKALHPMVEVAMVDDEHGGKLDRELSELLQELRIALPGVQVLFAFLLTIPFAQRFTIISGAQKTAYFIAFLSTAVATALLIAPSAYHRIRWRQRDKEQLLRTSTKFTLLGLASLTVAMTSTIFVVTDVLYDTAWAC